jgi:hypothetical protein
MQILREASGDYGVHWRWFALLRPVLRKEAPTRSMRVVEVFRKRATPQGTEPPPTGLERHHPRSQCHSRRRVTIAEAGVPVTRAIGNRECLEFCSTELGKKVSVDPVLERARSWHDIEDVRDQISVAQRSGIEDIDEEWVLMLSKGHQARQRQDGEFWVHCRQQIPGFSRQAIAVVDYDIAHG